MNDLIILAMLTDGPQHGYELKRKAGFFIGHGDMHNNLVYPLLRRFTRQGWVTKKSVPGKRGQTRQQYALTAAGRKELLNRLKEFSDSDVSSQRAFITRVGMFELLDPDIRVRILEQRETYLRNRKDRLKGLSGKIEVGSFGEEVVAFLVEETRAELGWIRRLRRVSGTKTPGR